MWCCRHLLHDGALSCVVVVLGIFSSVVSSACTPDVHSGLISDSAVLQDEAIAAAFAQVQQNLSSLFTNTSDGLSFAVVHASSPDLVFTFNQGRLKMNDSSSTANITSDSVFRVASVSKSLAAFSALAVQNLSRAMAAADPGIQPFSLDTPVCAVLPSFRLPDEDWLNGGSEITLSMLGSHSSGLTREGYSTTDFNMVTPTSRANASNIGARWASITPDDVVEYINGRNLMFGPGQRAAYSNAGFAILGHAVASYRNTLTGTSDSWAVYVQNDLFGPLGMDHSFFGPVPPEAAASVGVPGVANWVDLVVDGYNPAGGMWSSASDLASYLHRAWLSPTTSLITTTQRRQSLAPRVALPDGAQQVGFGWEVDVTPRAEKTYFVYGKSGDAAGNHAWIDVVPNLGYGLVVLSQESGEEGKTRIRPTSVGKSVHEILMPAFETALANVMTRRFVGNYTIATDSGLIPDEVANTTTSAAVGAGAGAGPQSYALLEVAGGNLFIRTLMVNGTDALEGIDKLNWKVNATEGGRFFSVKGVGSGLNPSEVAGDAAQLAGGAGAGAGRATIWRTVPALDECDWVDFGGYTDQNGWPLSQVALVERGGGAVELHYPPFDIVLSRS